MNFKLQDSVPEYYVNESRDFQLLCRVIDVYMKGILNGTNYIPYQLNLDKCSERLLYAIANMQGFTTSKYIPSAVLRNICRVFPYCIKRKGTKEAIELISYAVLATDNIIYYINIEVIGESGNPLSDHCVNITCNAQSSLIPYLNEALRFIMPTGWKVNYKLVSSKIYNYSSNLINSNKFARLSGITGKVMGVPPLSIEFNYDSANSPGSNTPGMYSRVGLIKIIKSRDVEALTKQTGLQPNSQAPLQASLIDSTRGNTVFIGNNITFSDKAEGE